MANYKLVIPTSDGTTTGGYSAAGTNTDFVIDRGAGRQSQQRILSAKFGDGYEQRVLDGINTKEETFSVTFNNRSDEEVDAIADYFDAIAPASFNFYIGDDTVKTVCENYSITYSHAQSYSLSAQLRRVYE